MGECTVRWCLDNRQTLSFQDEVPLLTTVGGTDSCLCSSTIPSNIDIAGVGVVVGFLASALLTLLASGLCLLLSRSVETDGVASFNPIDRWFRRACHPVKRLAKICGFDPGRLSDALYDMVISLADQQIIQGNAILGSAAIRTYDATSSTILSTYHLAMIGNLAWLSSNTHLLAILVARSRMDSSKPSSAELNAQPKRKASSRTTDALRAFFMLTLAALLLWLSWLGGDSGFYDSVQCPAACLVHSQNGKGGEPKFWMIFNFVYVFYNYIGMMAPQVSRRVRTWWMYHVSLRVHSREGMQPKPLPMVGKWEDLAKVKPRQQNRFEDSPALGKFVAPFRAATQGLLYIIKGFGWLFWIKEGSETLSFLELIVYFSLGIYWTAGEWLEAHDKMDAQGTRTTWTFAQLVPLIALIIPVFQLVDSYTSHADKKREAVDIKEKEVVEA